MGWIKSPNTMSITFTVRMSPDSYIIVALSKSGHSFCFNSANSGAGVTPGTMC